jgi:hypothetical protein
VTRPIAALAYDAGTAHLYRSIVYALAVRDGTLLPRWTQELHWGLGSPLFTFHAPLAYALLDLLARLGIPQPIGWRLLIAGGFLIAFGGMYGLVRQLTGQRWPAIFAATAFLYAPYVLRNALERGSAETFSMFLYPAVLWSLLWLARRPGIGRFAVATLLWTACIAFHVLGPLMLAPVAGLCALLSVWRRRTATPLLALVVGVLLTAPIWAPAFAEQAYVHVERDYGYGRADPVNMPLPLDRLLALPVVHDVQRDNNAIGERIGLAQVALPLGGLTVAGWAWRRRRRGLAAALLVAGIAGIAFFVMLTAAADPLWRLFGEILARLQYRSRLMGLQALFAALAGGLALALLGGRRQQQQIAGALAGALLLSALPSLYVELQHRYGDFDATLNLAQVRAAEIRSGGSAFTLFGEFTPRERTAPFDAALLAELGPDFDPQTRPLVNPPDAVKLLASQVRTGRWDLDLAATEPSTLTLYLLYYPRWQATVDGQPVSLTAQAATGYAQLAVPAGTHHVALRYGRTSAEWAGLAISAATLAGLLAVAGRAIWRRKSVAPAASRPEAEAADEPAPPLWLLIGVSALLIFKFAYVDGRTTWLRCVSTAERVCGAQATVDVAFAGAPGLRGYTVSSSDVRRGAEVRVDLYWQGEGIANRKSQIANRSALSSFVHIRRSRPEQAPSPVTGGDIWAQVEHVAPGGLLTAEFLPGKLYKDEFRVRIPADMPPGEYFLEVGWFDPATGEQLDPAPETVTPPLKILWRSILLPSLHVKE